METLAHTRQAYRDRSVSWNGLNTGMQQHPTWSLHRTAHSVLGAPLFSAPRSQDRRRKLCPHKGQTTLCVKGARSADRSPRQTHRGARLGAQMTVSINRLAPAPGCVVRAARPELPRSTPPATGRYPHPKAALHHPQRQGHAPPRVSCE